MNARDSLSLALEDITEGMSASVDFVVDANDMARFAELSGDHNPLHRDDAFARAKGFEGAVVYGGLIVAKVSQLIGMRLPGRDAVWASLGLDFRKPLYVGREAQVEGSVASVSAATGMLTLKLRVRAASGELLARGTAEVLLVR